MASPAEQIASILSKAIAEAIEKEKDTLSDIAKNAKSSGGDNPLGQAGDFFGIIFSAISAIPVIGELFSVPEDVINEVVKAGGNTGALFAIGYVLGQVGWQMIQPLMREGVHASEATFTSQIFDAQTAAELTAQGLITGDFATQEAAGGGWDTSHFVALKDAAINFPDIGQLNQMLNLGLINASQYQLGLQRHSYEPSWYEALQGLARLYLSPADLALASLRGVLDADQAQSYAAMLGVTSDDFATLIGNTGEPPGLMQLLEAYRRGFIDEPTLEEGIRQSRVRDQWIPTVEALRYVPMSTADAARAYVQNYLQYDDAAAIAQENGLEPDHWQYIAESWGRPLAHGEMIQLYYRGLVTQDDFDQAMRESYIKDKYIQWSFDLGVKLPSLWQITQLLKDGAITADMATTLLLEQGYQQDVVTAIVAGSSGGKAAGTKHLTASEYVTMYSDGLVSPDDTVKNLEALGYSETDANWLMSIADAKAQASIMRAAITTVKQQYNRRLLDESEATNELTAVGVTPKQAGELVKSWGAVRAVPTKTLTEAQTMKALKDGIIDPTDALNRLMAIGYSNEDAVILMAAYGDYGTSTSPTLP